MSYTYIADVCICVIFGVITRGRSGSNVDCILTQRTSEVVCADFSCALHSVKNVNFNEGVVTVISATMQHLFGDEDKLF